MLRVTLPLMISPMILVFALQLLRVFSSFETELLLGTPFGFFVYSTKIYALVRSDVPNYGEATALASITLLLLLLIVPLQRHIIQRRRYTTITGSFRPGLIDLGVWKLRELRGYRVLDSYADHRPPLRVGIWQLHGTHRLFRARVHA